MTGIFSAFGLSASAGLNTYMPLLIVAVCAKIGIFTLEEPFDVMTSWWIIGVLAERQQRDRLLARGQVDDDEGHHGDPKERGNRQQDSSQGVDKHGVLNNSLAGELVRPCREVTVASPPAPWPKPKPAHRL